MLTSFMQLSKAQILLSSFMGVSGDEMAGQHHQSSENEPGHMVRDREPRCAAVHGAVESHMTGRLNNKTLKLPDGDDEDQSRDIGNRE